MSKLLTLDEARLMLDPPLSLMAIIEATQREVDGKRELKKVSVKRAGYKTGGWKTFIHPANLASFAARRGLKIKLDIP